MVKVGMAEGNKRFTMKLRKSPKRFRGPVGVWQAEPEKKRWMDREWTGEAEEEWMRIE